MEFCSIPFRHDGATPRRVKLNAVLRTFRDFDSAFSSDLGTVRLSRGELMGGWTSFAAGTSTGKASDSCRASSGSATIGSTRSPCRARTNYGSISATSRCRRSLHVTRSSLWATRCRTTP